MNKLETDYKILLDETLKSGCIKENRTGIDTFSSFNKSLTIDLDEGFPIVTGKRMFFDKALHEYLWIINGLTHLTYLHQHGIKWWDQYADKNGYLGKTYGYQIRSFNGEIDQLDYIHREIRNNSRRAHITLWNPSELNEVILPPCYTGFTFMRMDDELNMTMQLRSSDMFLGLPYDICVAALMLTDIAIFNELKPKKLGIQITDGHIYENHLRAATEYINSNTFKLPKLSIFGNHKSLLNYKCGPHILAKLNN